MSEDNNNDLEVILKRIHIQAQSENIRVTQHAQQEMAEEDIKFDDVIEAIEIGQVLENYPKHRRGSCCLLNGFTQSGRPLHIVCTTTQPTLIIITVYEPKPPKWITPKERRKIE